MTHTQYNDDHARIIRNRATGYRKKNEGFEIAMSDFEQVGDGGVLTSVEDLQRWDENFYDPRVGDPKLLEAMQTVGVLNSGKKLEYASALYLSSYRGLPTVSHGGSWAGYRAQLLRFPQQRFSVACLCNLGNANPSRFAQRVAEVYLGDRMKPAEPEGEAKKPGGKPAAPVQDLQKLAGAYRNPANGEMVRLSARDDALAVEIGGRQYALSPVGMNRFRRVEGQSGVSSETVFEPGARGARPRMRVTSTDEDGEVESETFEPVEPWTPTAAELDALAGTYASRELDTTWRLVAEGGKLFIRHRGMPKEPLVPTIGDAMTLEGMRLSFSRGPARTVTGFTLDAGRVRGVVFSRVAN
jgi:hypothetical protein